MPISAADQGQPHNDGAVTTREQWAARIAAVLYQTIRRTVEGFIKTGRMLIDAKAALDYGEFTAMIERDLPFGERTAQKLMAIAKDRRLPNHVTVLPPAWSTLYEITRLPDDALERAITEGRITPDMERADVQKLVPEPEPVIFDHEPEPSPERDQGPPELVEAVESIERQREIIESLSRDADDKVTREAKKRRTEQQIAVERFEESVRRVCFTCETVDKFNINIPDLTAAKFRETVKELGKAKACVEALTQRVLKAKSNRAKKAKPPKKPAAELVH